MGRLFANPEFYEISAITEEETVLKSCLENFSQLNQHRNYSNNFSMVSPSLFLAKGLA